MNLEENLNNSVKFIEEEILNYVESRKNSIKKKSETPRLAALLTEKYIMGQIKALEIVFHSFDRAVPNFTFNINDILLEICPDFEKDTKLRWSAKPADLMYK